MEVDSTVQKHKNTVLIFRKREAARTVPTHRPYSGSMNTYAWEDMLISEPPSCSELQWKGRNASKERSKERWSLNPFRPFSSQFLSCPNWFHGEQGGPEGAQHSTTHLFSQVTFLLLDSQNIASETTVISSLPEIKKKNMKKCISFNMKSSKRPLKCEALQQILFKIV